MSIILLFFGSKFKRGTSPGGCYMVNEISNESREDFFSERYYRFLRDLPPLKNLPDETEVIYPYADETVQKMIHSFFDKYFRDNNPRIFLIGINPGRFGGGVTGLAFTDPVYLEESCGIANPFPKTHELSSRFIYEMIESYGGADLFYSHVFLTAFSPLGFTWKGKNRNYYDTPGLWNTLKPWILETFRQQLALGADRNTAFCLGQGKNYRILQELNREHHFFKEIRPLPHPRWIMQYRLKRKEEFLTLYREEINKARGGR